MLKASGQRHLPGGGCLRLREASFAYITTHRTGAAGAGGRPAFDPALIGGLGDIAEHTVLVSRGWSGNAIERVVLADGSVLIAMRIVPGADWIGRASADPGREGLLLTAVWRSAKLDDRRDDPVSASRSNGGRRPGRAG